MAFCGLNALHPLCVRAVCHMSWIEIIKAWGNTVRGVIPWGQLQVQLFTKMLRLLDFLAYKDAFTHTFTQAPWWSNNYRVQRWHLMHGPIWLHFYLKCTARCLKVWDSKALWRTCHTARSLPYHHALCLTLVNHPKSALHTLCIIVL